jgi:hypothetical protein
MTFLTAAANLHAYNYGIVGMHDEFVIKLILESVIVPEFVPKTGVQVQIKDDDPVGTQGLSKLVTRGAGCLDPDIPAQVSATMR